MTIRAVRVRGFAAAWSGPRRCSCRRRNLRSVAASTSRPLSRMAGFQLSINGRFWMSTEANVQLQIEHTPTQQAPLASRDVAVDYQIGFTQAEVDARANFQVRVSLLSNGNDVL